MKTRRIEILKLLAILIIAIGIMFLIPPGLQESPYNHF